MLQRVQSLYLLCSIIFMAIFAFMPYCSIETPDATYQINSWGIKATQVLETTSATIVSSSHYAVAIIVALTIILSIITIFLFANRTRQILLCKINILFYIALYIVMGIFTYINYHNMQGFEFTPNTYAIFPICALITNWLAMTAINKDEQMVRDSERMWTRNK